MPAPHQVLFRASPSLQLSPCPALCARTHARSSRCACKIILMDVGLSRNTSPTVVPCSCLLGQLRLSP